MTVFRTCRSCRHKGDCEIQGAIRAAIKGLGVTSLKHSCKAHETPYQIGEPVWAMVQARPATEEEGYHGEAAPKDWYAAHYVGIAAASNLRALVLVMRGARSAAKSLSTPFTPLKSDDANNRGAYAICRLPWDRIIKRAEGEALPVCEQCGQLKGMKCEGPRDWDEFKCSMESRP